MSTTRAAVGSGIDVSLLIQAPPDVVLKAFFDADAIGVWWQAVRSVTTPRALGAYAIEWPPTDFSDELLGRLGGVFRGTVVQFEGNRSFFVADAYWLPPDAEPIGPMALEVAVTPSGDSDTEVRVRQTGFEESPRWRRYYEVAGVGWERALRAMKILLET
jgi:uncharacterized protein YndB with AHSA1/START domain